MDEVLANNSKKRRKDCPAPAPNPWQPKHFHTFFGGTSKVEFPAHRSDDEAALGSPSTPAGPRIQNWAGVAIDIQRMLQAWPEEGVYASVLAWRWQDAPGSRAN